MSSVSIRSYLAAGVAAAGVGAIALSPVHPVTPALAALPQQVSHLAVNLAAAVDPVDPFTAWVDVITTAITNGGDLAQAWVNGVYVQGTPPGNTPATQGYQTGVAFPIIQQILSNLITYVGELPDFGGIISQAFGNIGNAVQSPFAPGVEIEEGLPLNQNVNATPNVDGGFLGQLSQRQVLGLLPLVAGDAYASLKPILDFATTPISGVLVGAIGPIVAPVLALVNSVSNTIALLQESNFVGAITELINIPANAVNAFLNGGQVLDLTGLVGLLGVQLPDSIESIGLKMGGLLSPGGVAFDAVAAKASATLDPLPPVSITDTGLPVGPIGALFGLGNYVAQSIKVTPAPTPPGSAVRAAAADAEVQAAPAVEAEVVATADEPVALAAERAQDDPAPATHRQTRRAGASADRSGDSAQAASATKTAPKSSAARRGAR